MAIVTRTRTLKAMQAAGWIKWLDGFSRHWTGLRVRNYFVEPGSSLARWDDEFKHGRKKYRIKYFSGCFHPFVVEVGKECPEFV